MLDVYRELVLLRIFEDDPRACPACRAAARPRAFGWSAIALYIRRTLGRPQSNFCSREAGQDLELNTDTVKRLRSFPIDRESECVLEHASS